ncbi:MAG: asparagine--tRNA ligase [Candidatus Dasytiphilus stammeri]
MYLVSVIDIFKEFIKINKIITVNGWVRTIRNLKSGVIFINLYDGSCLSTLQIVVDNSISNYSDICRLSTGCSICVTGKLVFSVGNKQKFEIINPFIKILGWVENQDSYPISAKYHSKEYLREVAHLRPRTNFIGAISRIRHTLAYAIHQFFNEKGYFWISTPIITSLDIEGTSKLFRVSTLDLNHLPRDEKDSIDFTKDFFSCETFLTGTGQLNAEAYACALTKVYSFGPTFRAENSNTTRHLSEFWMVEPEVAFATLDDIISIAENMLKYVITIILKERIDDLIFFRHDKNSNLISRLEQFLQKKIEVIDYNQAIKILLASNNKFKKDVFWGIDFSSEHERFIAENKFNAPVVVINYPKEIKPFYMRLNENNKTVASMDLFVPGLGEIIGGSQREERIYILDQRIKEMGLNPMEYWWYRDLRRYGTVPHSGFGLGFERLIAYVTGISNIRDVIPFPRIPHNANF